MMESLSRHSVSELPSGSVAEKNVIVNIPSEQQPEAETHLGDAPKNLYDLPDKGEEIVPVNSTEETSAPSVFIPPNDDTILPSNDEPTSLSVFDESSADGKNVHESLMPKTEDAKTNEQPLENHEKSLSLQGYANNIFTQTPPNAEEILGREEGRLTPKESLSSSSLDTEEENVELSAEVNSGISPVEVSCIMGEGPVEGALPSTFSKETTSRIGAKVIKSATNLVPAFNILLVF